MASFRKRQGPNGRTVWQAQVVRRGYPRQYRTCDTKTAARIWARQVEAEIARGVFIDRTEAERTTLRDALTRYQREVTPHKKGAVAENRRIEQLKKTSLAILVLAAIRGREIADYRDQRLRAVAPPTVRLELALISHVYEVARKEWGIGGIGNPVRDVRLPAKSKARDRRLLPGEEKRLMAAARRLYREMPQIIELALATGMRRGEMAGLCWSDVDLRHRTVTLHETKNGTQRIVPLSRAAIAALETLGPCTGDGNVFQMSINFFTVGFGRVVADARERYERACQRANWEPDPYYLVDLRLHDLRHEATSRLFEKGLSLLEVQAITGHKTLQMLLRYTHLRASDLVRKLD